MILRIDELALKQIRTCNATRRHGWWNGWNGPEWEEWIKREFPASFFPASFLFNLISNYKYNNSIQ